MANFVIIARGPLNIDGWIQDLTGLKYFVWVSDTEQAKYYALGWFLSLQTIWESTKVFSIECFCLIHFFFVIYCILKQF